MIYLACRFDREDDYYFSVIGIYETYDLALEKINSIKQEYDGCDYEIQEYVLNSDIINEAKCV